MAALNSAVVLLDPNTLSTAERWRWRVYSISDDGNLMAYGLRAGESNWED